MSHDSEDRRRRARAALQIAVDDPIPLPEGETDGRYDLGVRLGIGGMGEVHLAFDQNLRREVAFKTLRTDRAGGAKRFEHEAQVTGQLEHPNIVPVYDLGEAPDGTPFYTMKRVEGRSLAELLRLGAAGSLVRRLDVFNKVCDAMAYAHARGVVHRDLKPGNIMVGQFGEVLVLDWGLAKIVGQSDIDEIVGVSTDRSDSGPGGSTRVGTVLGTPAYMAPEQAKSGDVDARADIFALGGVLRALLSDGESTEESSRAETRRMATSAEKPLGKSALPTAGDIPRELWAIVQRATELDRERRYQTVGDMRADVQAWLEGKPVSVVRYGFMQRVAKWAGRHRRVVAAVLATSGIALLALVGSGAAYLRSVTQARDRALLAERDAEIRRVDAEVALALVESNQGRVSTARERLAAAVDAYARVDADDQRARIAESWVATRYPPPVLTWRGADARLHRGLRISPDGRRAVLVDVEGTVYIVSIPDGRELARHQLPHPNMRRIWLSNTHLRIALAKENEFQIWDAEAGVIAELPGGRGVEMFDPEHAFTASPEGVQVWSLPEGRRLGRLISDIHNVRSASRDMRFLLGDPWPGGVDRSPIGLYLFDRQQHQVVARWPGSDRGKLTPDGRWVARHLPNGNARIEQIATGEGFEVPPPWNANFEFADEGRLFLGRSFSGDTRVYEVESGRLRAQFATDLAAASFTSDARLAVTRDPEAMRLWMFPAEGPPGHTYKGDPTEEVAGIDFTSDGTLLATASRGGRLRVIERRSGAILRDFVTTPKGSREVAISPDGGTAVTADRDGRLRVWDLVQGKMVRAIGEGQAIAASVSFLSDGRRVAAGWENGQVGVVDIETGRALWTAQSPQTRVWDIDVSPDHQRMMSTGRHYGKGPLGGEPQVVVWDVSSGEQLFVSQDIGVTYDGVFSPDGQHVALASNDGVLRVVDLQGGDTWAERQDDVAFVAVDWAAGHDIIAAGLLDGKVRLWSSQSREELITLEVHETGIGELAFVPGEPILLASDGTGNVAVIDLQLAARFRENAITAGENLEGASRMLAVGRGAALRRDWETAARFLQRAHEAGAAVPQLERASALWAAGRYEESREALQRALAAGEGLPGAVQVWLNAPGSAEP